MLIHPLLVESIIQCTAGPFGPSSTLCVTALDADDAVKQLRASGRKKSGRAATIISAALDVGYTSVEAIHIAIVASAESGLEPSATAAGTGAAGYFQLVPKYWDTSGPSTDWSALTAQLKQIKKRYGSGVLRDLAVLYGTHFLPGLGRAYGSTKTIGARAGSKTYNQYIFEDANGTTFHSPVIMAAFAALRFFEFTGVDPLVDVPSTPLVCSLASGSGGRIVDQVGLVLPIIPGEGKRFKVGSASEHVQVSLLDPAGVADFSSVAPSLDDVEWINAGQILDISFGEEDVSLDADYQNIQHQIFVPERTVLSYANNILWPSLDTLIHAIRAKTIDLEILKAAVLSTAFDEGSIGAFIDRDPKNNRIRESENSVLLNKSFSDDQSFVEWLEDFSTAELNAVLETLLYTHLSGSSLAGLSVQLTHHRSIMTHIDIKDFGGDGNPDVWDIPWLLYCGVLFPYSLLVTPRLGGDPIRSTLSLSSRFALSLIRWTKAVIGNTGTKSLMIKVHKIARKIS